MLEVEELVLRGCAGQCRQPRPASFHLVFNSPDHKKRHFCSCFPFPGLLAPRAGWSEPPRPGRALPVLAGGGVPARADARSSQGCVLLSCLSVCPQQRLPFFARRARCHGFSQALGFAGEKAMIRGEAAPGEHRCGVCARSPGSGLGVQWLCSSTVPPIQSPQGPQPSRAPCPTPEPDPSPSPGPCREAIYLEHPRSRNL